MMSYHYDTLRILTPKCFAGPGDIAIDFTYEDLGNGTVQFLPLISGGVAQEFDWDFGDGTSHSTDVSPIHDYGDV